MKKILITSALALTCSLPSMAAFGANEKSDVNGPGDPQSAEKITANQDNHRPMRILIVNDDGCRSAGTVSLKQKLDAKGYEAWIVAPDTNQSGIGSAITFKPGKEFQITKLGDKHYCFPGTPADALDFGVEGILRNVPVDLVISGVNDGPNTGMAQANSGTVNAAIRALRHGYPAIAASIGVIPSDEEAKNGFPQTKKYWPESVDYVVEVVDALNKNWQADVPVLPKNTGLSINYPPLDKKAIKGVKYINNEFTPAPQFFYEVLPDGNAKQVLRSGIFSPTDADTDTGWLDKGYIIYTIMTAPQVQPNVEAAYREKLDNISGIKASQ
ncbi:5'/3'-nucleotidase SurE [Orbaceae bacterium ESL0727]|nr:5'/3'-nucleotidase SurE [Orbaceae bacterium ESL0727]